MRYLPFVIYFNQIVITGTTSTPVQKLSKDRAAPSYYQKHGKEAFAASYV